MRIKMTLLICLTVILTSLVSYMIYKMVKTKQANQLTNNAKKNLPNFAFYNLDSVVTSNKFITKNKPVCVYYFNTDCEHCQYEAKEINRNITLFKNVQIVMVSFNTIKEIKAFAKQYNLNYSNLTFLQDPKYQFSNWFGKASIPSVFIYNSKHKLVKEYQGETKIEAITKYL